MMKHLKVYVVKCPLCELRVKNLDDTKLYRMLNTHLSLKHKIRKGKTNAL